MPFMVTPATIGSDAEVKYTPSGTPICSFRAAVNTGFGERKKTLWFSCAKFGKGAEGLAQYLKKGTKIVIQGKFDAREWQNSNGETKTSLEINVSDIDFAGSPQGGGTHKPQSSPSQRAQTPPAFDDDMPF